MSMTTTRTATLPISRTRTGAGRVAGAAHDSLAVAAR